jgi:dTDP-4-dehydrorhamnose 3,5-epimerase
MIDKLSTQLKDVYLYESKVYGDERGSFRETWKEGVYDDFTFVQDNVSISQKGIVRGLHFQRKQPQGKLVSVITGSVIDVVIDLRKSSPTFLKYETFYLNGAGRQLYVPEGYGHGFISLEDNTVFSYKCTDFYDPKDELVLLFDEVIDITTLVPPQIKPQFSEKDKEGLTMKFIEKNNIFFK